MHTWMAQRFLLHSAVLNIPVASHMKRVCVHNHLKLLFEELRKRSKMLL